LGYNKNNRKLFIFIDEIQYLENPSSFLKIIADHHPKLKLIVSGSSSFQIKKKFKDSLVGRTVNFELYPLCFREFLLFREYPFIEGHLYTDKKIGELKSLYKEYILCGGYPKITLTPDMKMREKYLQQIIDTYIRKDIRDLAEIKDANKFNRLIEALSSQCGQLLNVMELSNTCKIAKQTIEHYLFLLEQTYVIRLVRPFSSNLRSELSKTPKIFFYDTGLMQMLWLKELPKEPLGSVFETSVFAELAKKYGTDKIFFWRTTDKKEIDFILKDIGSALPLEVKLNFSRIRLAAINYFLDKYKLKKYKIVGLEGDRKTKHYCYPWEL
jgi:predicted AAA+ superfamily ATPase